MQVQTIKLSEASQKAAKSIIDASRGKTTLSQQTLMANYYAYLHSPKNTAGSIKDYAKILLGK